MPKEIKQESAGEHIGEGSEAGVREAGSIEFVEAVENGETFRYTGEKPSAMRGKVFQRYDGPENSSGERGKYFFEARQGDDGGWERFGRAYFLSEFRGVGGKIDLFFEKLSRFSDVYKFTPEIFKEFDKFLDDEKFSIQRRSLEDLEEFRIVLTRFWSATYGENKKSKRARKYDQELRLIEGLISTRSIDPVRIRASEK